ncbi:hypothetical protein PybrP1_000233 [[Pythium] brassicae (nom. inval.)]|nr:hypothetical protein PybrP1_000233 [[Pythium] brassicae (nom. inval.)]
MARHNAAGLDQIPSDFFIDCGEGLASGFLAGQEPPEQFAQGLIIPLRKKDDSNNAMEYRLITLLQSCYMVFAKVIANRVREGLHIIVGDSQQGFVRARRGSLNAR